MAWVITRLCRECVDQSCVEVCPVDCIYEYTGGDAESFPNQLYIDPEECINCGVRGRREAEADAGAGRREQGEVGLYGLALRGAGPGEARATPPPLAYGSLRACRACRPAASNAAASVSIGASMSVQVSSCAAAW